MRVNRYVALASGLSRRAADIAVSAGRVSVNGTAAVIGQTVEQTDEVRLDGKLLALPTEHQLVMLHKPAGYVSSRMRQGQDPTLYSLLPKQFRRLRIVGRLDRDSSGLLLLTDDGDFIYRHTHPSFGKIKVYDVTLSHDLKPTDRDKLAAGIMLTDGLSKLNVVQANGPEVRVSLAEGRNRQVRRTFGAIGYDTLRLHRVQMGAYQLGELPEGAWQEINFA